MWFPGVHSDVGGGYAKCGLSDTALLWMVGEARAKGLVFDERLLEVYLGSGKPAVLNDSLTSTYRTLNVLSQTRMTLTRTGRRFTHGWRRPDPPPDPRKPERAVGVRISSTAVGRFTGDPTYHHPNLAEFSRAPGFGDHEERVEPLPRT